MLCDWLVSLVDLIVQGLMCCLCSKSGITPELLSDVTTYLGDVQSLLQSRLPSNTILCGHSLNFDLAALKVNISICSLFFLHLFYYLCQCVLLHFHGCVLYLVLYHNITR